MSTAPTGYQTPKTNWAAGNVPTATDFNRIEGNINAVETGSRTIDPAQAPTGNNGTLRQLLDWFANRIKAITGKTNWYDAPDITLATLAQHKSRHATGGADALTPADIGAAAASDLAAHLAEIVTTPQANKILRLDANAKLPTSITGDAATVAGKSVGNGSGQVPVSNGTVCTNLNSDKVDSIHFRVSNGILQYSTDGSVWYDVAVLFSTSVKGSYSTTSSTWVTALNYAGKGALRHLKFDAQANGTTPKLRITVDGTIIAEHSPTTTIASNAAFYIDNKWPLTSNATCVVVESSLQSMQAPLDIEFKSSLKIEIASNGSRTLTCTWLLSAA